MAEVVAEGFTIRPMVEDDLREVMHIEMRSFPNPWAPLAFVTELRYNGDATYVVARDTEGKIRGYIGWWTVDGESAITHVAVDSSVRRCGLGRQLVNHAIEGAKTAGAARMRLQVRECNEGARALYRKVGFDEEGRIPEYYDNPPDDAVVMTMPLEGEPTTAATNESKERGDR